MTLPWLHVERPWIKDEVGNRVALRGVGFDYTAYKRPADLRWFFEQAKGRGYSCVRLAFGIAPWYEHHVFYDPVLMDATLDLCEEFQMYAILDCMDWWARPDIQGWEAPLPLHEGVWLDTWRNISTRYKDRSVIAAYELYNEPLGEGTTPDGKGQYEVYMDCINMLRANGDNHILVVYDSFQDAWRTWESNASIPNRTIWSPSTKPSDSNIMYATHRWWGEGKANPYDFAWAHREAAEYVYGLKTYSDWMGGVPVWAGEFGVYDYSDYSHADWEYVREIIRLCEDAGIPWNVWSMDAFIGYAPEALIHITPTPYMSNYYPADIPRPFQPKPFNLLEYIVDKSWCTLVVGQNRWGTTWTSLPHSAFWVTLEGPIKLRRKVWEGQDPYGALLIDEIIAILDGEQIRFEGTSYTEIYAEQVSHKVSLQSQPAGATIKIDGVPYLAGQEVTLEEGIHIFETPKEVT